ncbi:hypothetical protein [Acinetobacter junii]|jgi:uncharacterized protein YegP (UPF0339 family)|uniref:hypothetical protein n=1 Tax=Acinetobacter junii TaxID=40215 RepID=UPI00100DAE09|nr:hypothetical protein [Acinetobacter junii]RXT01508.1 hypothetical protein ETZ13_00695 [Acinetobacter junii]
MTQFKKLFISLLIVFSLLISFAMGALTSGLNYWFQPLVHIQISNQSGQPIKELKLLVKTASTQHEISFSSLENNKAIKARFFVEGEGEYRLEATLANGQIISSSQGYIESGSTVNELVQSNQITSKVSY